MFFAIILIAIGVALLFNAIIPIGASFWGIFWGIIFLAVGIKMVRNKGCCSMGNGAWWNDKVGSKMGEDECDCECGNDCESKSRK